MFLSPFLPIPEPRRSSQHLPLRVISVSESRAVRCIIEVSAPCTHGLLCGVMFRWVDVFLLITIWRSNPELPAYWEAADVFGFKSLGGSASITVGCLSSLFHSICLDNISWMMSHQAYCASTANVSYTFQSTPLVSLKSAWNWSCDSIFFSVVMWNSFSNKKKCRVLINFLLVCYCSELMWVTVCASKHVNRENMLQLI